MSNIQASVNQLIHGAGTLLRRDEKRSKSLPKIDRARVMASLSQKQAEIKQGNNWMSKLIEEVSAEEEKRGAVADPGASWIEKIINETGELEGL